jgi:hypothetical protein
VRKAGGQQAREASGGLGQNEAHFSASRRWSAVVCSSSRGARRTRPEGVAEWCFGVSSGVLRANEWDGSCC